MMRPDVIFKRWIDILAGLLLGWQERRRARRCLKIVQEQDRLVIRQVRGKDETSLGTFAAGAMVPAEITREAQRCFVILELSAEEVISRRMSVPAQARDLLPGIVRNQIERLSAWRASQAAFGFDVTPNADATSLDVDVLITSRLLLDETCSRLAQVGLRVDRVVAGEQLADGAAPVTLWSRLADAPDRSVTRGRWMIGGLVAATVCLTMIVSGWAFVSAASADSENEEIAARVATLRRQVQGAFSQQSIAALAPAERAWALKETSPVAVIIVEALSRSLPDSSHLTELNLDGSTLRIAGLADDTPALIGALEKSGHLKDVHFSAPTTRGADGTGYVFHIEARVEPHPKIDGS